MEKFEWTNKVLSAINVSTEWSDGVRERVSQILSQFVVAQNSTSNNKAMHKLKYIIDELIKVASEMAQRLDMPSQFVEDWNFPKSVSNKQAIRVVSAAYLADERCRRWSIRVRELADKLRLHLAQQDTMETKKHSTNNESAKSVLADIIDDLQEKGI